MYSILFAILWAAIGAIGVGLFALLAATDKALLSTNPKQHTAQRALALGLLVVMVVLAIISYYASPC